MPGIRLSQFSGIAPRAALRSMSPLRISQAISALGTKVFAGLTSRDISLTGAQSITGVGFTPQAVFLFSAVNTTFRASVGFATALLALSLRDNSGVSSGTYSVRTDGATAISIVTDATNFAEADVSSMDADGFTLTWTKTGTPTGTATIAFLAIS